MNRCLLHSACVLFTVLCILRVQLQQLPFRFKSFFFPHFWPPVASCNAGKQRAEQCIFGTVRSSVAHLKQSSGVLGSRQLAHQLLMSRRRGRTRLTAVIYRTGQPSVSPGWSVVRWTGAANLARHTTETKEHFDVTTSFKAPMKLAASVAGQG